MLTPRLSINLFPALLILFFDPSYFSSATLFSSISSFKFDLKDLFGWSFFHFPIEAERSKSDLESVLRILSFTLCWSRQGDHKVEPKISVWSLPEGWVEQGWGAGTILELGAVVDGGGRKPRSMWTDWRTNSRVLLQQFGKIIHNLFTAKMSGNVWEVSTEQRGTYSYWKNRFMLLGWRI